ncbi:MAG: hypothetical protein KDI63_05535 [Gammaproteobacteria bacterium]|nr:hypothetical protein [Gammaproteobacteria bacterium]
MYTRHLEVPTYSRWNTAVDALHYNHVCCSLKRSRGDIRLDLPGLRTLDLILQENAWVVVDRAFNDIPVVAWCDFQAAGRDNIHLPVRCMVRLFHAHGELIMTRVLEAMELLLGEQFDPDPGNLGGRISPLKPR